jgi:hypothetical protein
MLPSGKRVLIIEFNEFHDETIFYQVDWLIRGRASVTVATTNQNMTSGFLERVSSDNCTLLPPNKKKGYCVVFKQLLKKKYDVCIFNTCDDTFVSLLCCFLPSTAKFIRVQHNLAPWQDDQSVYNRLKQKFFNLIIDFRFSKSLLVDPLLQIGRPNCLGVMPQLACAFPVNDTEKTKGGGIDIGIQGLIDYKRRNYKGILDALCLTSEDIRNKIRVHIIGASQGKDRNKFIEDVRLKKLESNILLYNDFLEYEQYYSICSKMDIMYLGIDEDVDFFKSYFLRKVSSTIAISFSFKVPMLVHSKLPIDDEISNVSVTYDSIENLAMCINKLATGEIDTAKLRANFIHSKRNNIEHNREKYLNFILE